MNEYFNEMPKRHSPVKIWITSIMNSKYVRYSNIKSGCVYVIFWPIKLSLKPLSSDTIDEEFDRHAKPCNSKASVK